MTRLALFTTAAERRRRTLDEIDASMRKLTTTLYVAPPDGGDVPGCVLCGVGAVTVPGDRTITREETEQTPVCVECSGIGRLATSGGGPGAPTWLDCHGCDGGRRTPQRTRLGETTFTVSREYRSLNRGDLAQLIWSRIRVEPYGALGVGGSRTVVLDLCPTCAEAYAEVRAFGPTVAERLLVARGWTLPIGAGFSSLREVAWGARWLAAHRRGRPTPRPNTEPWEHLDGVVLRVADGLAERVIEVDTGLVRPVHDSVKA